jgi:hypothetical protein
LNQTGILTKYVHFLDYLLIAIFLSFFFLPLFRYVKKRIKRYRRGLQPTIYDDDGNEIRIKHGRLIKVTKKVKAVPARKRVSLLATRGSVRGDDAPADSPTAAGRPSLGGGRPIVGGFGASSPKVEERQAREVEMMDRDMACGSENDSLVADEAGTRVASAGNANVATDDADTAASEEEVEEVLTEEQIMQRMSKAISEGRLGYAAVDGTADVEDGEGQGADRPASKQRPATLSLPRIRRSVKASPSGPSEAAILPPIPSVSDSAEELL